MDAPIKPEELTNYFVKYAEENKKLPKTPEDTLVMFEELKKIMIKDKPHLRTEINEKMNMMISEFSDEVLIDKQFVPMEINDYSLSTKLPEEKVVEELKILENLKHLFKIKELTFTKKEESQSQVTINTRKIKDFSFGDIIPISSLMKTCGLSSYQNLGI